MIEYIKNKLHMFYELYMKFEHTDRIDPRESINHIRGVG